MAYNLRIAYPIPDIPVVEHRLNSELCQEYGNYATLMPPFTPIAGPVIFAAYGADGQT